MYSRDYAVGAALSAIIGALIVSILSHLELLSLSRSWIIFSAAAFACATLLGIFLSQAVARWLPFAPQLVRYGIVGVFNTIVDMYAVITFAATTGLKSGILLASFNTFSFVAVNICAYFIHRHWSFGMTSRASLREFTLFSAVLGSSMIVNSTIVYVLTTVIYATDVFSQTVIIAKIIATVASFVWNFAWFRLVFRTTSIRA
ncbi:MAG: GtrA family protein [Minisyncoccia bacterium]